MKRGDLDLHESFVRYQVRYQERVFAFILTFVPNWNDAEEILQETSIVLWKKFPEFEIGTDFAKWANAVARLEIRKFHERQRRSAKILSDDVVSVLFKEHDSIAGNHDHRSRALKSCLEKLPASDRYLIIARYLSGDSTGSIATKLGRTVESVCNSLRRIRDRLLGCVHKELARE